MIFTLYTLGLRYCHVAAMRWKKLTSDGMIAIEETYDVSANVFSPVDKRKKWPSCSWSLPDLSLDRKVGTKQTSRSSGASGSRSRICMLVRSVHVAVEQEKPSDLVRCIEDT